MVELNALSLKLLKLQTLTRSFYSRASTVAVTVDRAEGRNRQISGRTGQVLVGFFSAQVSRVGSRAEFPQGSPSPKIQLRSGARPPTFWRQQLNQQLLRGPPEIFNKPGPAHLLPSRFPPPPPLSFNTPKNRPPPQPFRLPRAFFLSLTPTTIGYFTGIVHTTQLGPA